jgi:hypothetical protein
MSDPRNVAHDKKVIHEKQHHGENVSEGLEHAAQPGKKTAHVHPESKTTQDDLPDELKPASIPEPARLLG